MEYSACFRDLEDLAAGCMCASRNGTRQ